MLFNVMNFKFTKSTINFLPNFMYALYMPFQILVGFKTDSTKLTLPLITTLMGDEECMVFEFLSATKAYFTLCLISVSGWIFCEESIDFIRKLFNESILACVEFF